MINPGDSDNMPPPSPRDGSPPTLPDLMHQPAGVSAEEEQLSAASTNLGHVTPLRPGSASSETSEASSDPSAGSSHIQLTKRRSRKTWRQSIREQDDELELLSAGDMIVKCKTLQCKVRELEANLLEVNTQNTRLQNSQVTCQQTKGQLEETVTTLQAELEKLSSQLEVTEQQNLNLKDACMTADVELLRVKNELLTAQTETGKAVRELDIARKNAIDHSECMATEKRLMGTVAALKKELNLIRDDVADLSNKLEENNSTMAKSLVHQEENTEGMDDTSDFDSLKMANHNAMQQLAMHTLEMDAWTAKAAKMLSFCDSASESGSTDEDLVQDGDMKEKSKRLSYMMGDLYDRLQQEMDYSKNLRIFTKESVIKLGTALGEDCSLDYVSGPEEAFELAIALVEQACERIRRLDGGLNEVETNKIHRALDVWISTIKSIKRDISDRCMWTVMSEFGHQEKLTFTEKVAAFSNQMADLPEFTQTGFDRIEADGRESVKNISKPFRKYMNTWLETMEEVVDLCQNKEHRALNKESTAEDATLSTMEKAIKLNELSNELSKSVKHIIATHENEVDLIFLSIIKHVSELKRDLSLVECKRMKSVKSSFTTQDRLFQVLDGLDIFRVAIIDMQVEIRGLQDEREVQSTKIKELQVQLLKQSHIPKETNGNDEKLNGKFEIVYDKLLAEVRITQELLLEKEELMIKCKDFQIEKIMSCNDETAVDVAVDVALQEMQPMVDQIQVLAENIRDKEVLCMDFIMDLQRIHNLCQSLSKPGTEGDGHQNVIAEYETQLSLVKERIKSKDAMLAKQGTEITILKEQLGEMASRKIEMSDKGLEPMGICKEQVQNAKPETKISHDHIDRDYQGEQQKEKLKDQELVADFVAKISDYESQLAITKGQCAQIQEMYDAEVRRSEMNAKKIETLKTLQMELDGTRNKLSILETEKNKLAANLSEVQMDDNRKTELAAEVAELTAQNVECQLAIKERDLRIAQLTEEETKHRALIEKLNHNIDILRVEIQQDADQLSTMKEVHGNEVQHLKQEIQQMEKINRQQVHYLKQEVQQQNETGRKSCNDQSFNENIESVELKKNQGIEQLTKVKDENIKQLSDSKNQICDDCRHHENQVTQLEIKITSMKVEATELTKQVQTEAEIKIEILEQLSNLEGQLARQTLCSEELKRKMKQQAVELDRLEAELQQKDSDKVLSNMQQHIDSDLDDQGKIANIESENLGIQQLMIDMQIEIKRVKEEKDALIEGFNCEQENLMITKQNLEKDVVLLNARLKEVIEAAAAQQNTNKEEIARHQKTENTSLAVEKVLMEERVAGVEKYESCEVAFREQCAILHSEVDRLKASLGEKVCEMAKLKVLIGKKDSEVVMYAEQAKQHALTIVAIEERLNQVVEKNKQYRSDIEKQQQEINQYQCKIQESEEIEKPVDAVTLVTPPTIQTPAQQKLVIHNPSAASQQSIVRLRRENANLKNQNDQAQKVITGLRRDITGLAARLGDVAGEIDEAKKKEIDENRVKLSDNDRELSDHKAKVKDLFQVIDDKLADTRRLNSDVKRLKDGCLKLKKLVSERDRHVAELQDKLDKVKANQDKIGAEHEEQGKITRELAALGSSCRGERHKEIINNQKSALNELRTHLRILEQWPRAGPNNEEAFQQVMLLKKELAEIRARDSLSQTVPSMVQSMPSMVSQPHSAGTSNTKTDNMFTKSAHIVTMDTLDLSENSYMMLLRTVAVALEAEELDGLQSLAHIPTDEQLKLFQEREKTSGIIANRIRLLQERLKRKQDLLAGYEQDLTKLHRLEELTGLHEQQVTDLTNEVRQRTEETQCLRATLDKARSHIEPNRRYVTAVNDKNLKDKKMPNNKVKEASELMKKKNYEIKVLKIELRHKEQQLDSMKRQIINFNESQKHPCPPAGRPSMANVRRARPTSAKRPMSAKVPSVTRNAVRVPSPPRSARDVLTLFDDEYEVISSSADIRKSLETKDCDSLRGYMTTTPTNTEVTIEQGSPSSRGVSFSTQADDIHTDITKKPIVKEKEAVSTDTATLPKSRFITETDSGESSTP